RPSPEAETVGAQPGREGRVAQTSPSSFSVPTASRHDCRKGTSSAAREPPGASRKAATDSAWAELRATPSANRARIASKIASVMRDEILSTRLPTFVRSFWLSFAGLLTVGFLPGPVPGFVVALLAPGPTGFLTEGFAGFVLEGFPFCPEAGL